MPYSVVRTAIILCVWVAAGLSGIHLDARGQHVQFNSISSSVDGSEVSLSPRETHRLERFLSRVFPTRAMKHTEHTSEQPIVRRATYSIVSQQGIRFVLVGYSARWKELVDVLAIYRLEDDGPVQVWRSKPWEASYYGLHFWTAKSGNRNVVLFEEGGSDGEYALASIFSFQNVENGLITRDLTPTIPWLRAFTHFPFRPLYGQAISLTIDDAAKQSLLLSASDESYQMGLSTAYRPTRSWRYTKSHPRFERVVSPTDSNPRLTDARGK